MAFLGGAPQPRRNTVGGGAMRGLQSAGAGGVNAASPMQRAGQQVNQNVMQQYTDSPFLNQQGGYTFASGPAPMATGTNGMGQNIYGWANGAPVMQPTQNYVQFGPGEGPGMPRGGGGGGSRGPSGPTQEMGGQIAPLPPVDPVPDIQPIDDSAAWRATYGRAKETAGNQARRGMDALMELQGARGILSGGLGVAEIGQNIIGPAMNQLGDVNRQLAEQAYQAEVARQQTNYQGRINQRSQNYGGRGQELERRRYNASNLPRGQVAY